MTTCQINVSQGGREILTLLYVIMTTSALQHAGPHLTLFETRSLASRAMLCLYIFWASQSYERVAHDADN